MVTRGLGVLVVFEAVMLMKMHPEDYFPPLFVLHNLEAIITKRIEPGIENEPAIIV